MTAGTFCRFPGFAMLLSPSWCDITEDLPDGSPLTIARPDGMGALQFSVARWIGGPEPRPSAADLAAATFTQDTATVRAWYISREGSFAKVTYACEGHPVESELLDCEQMVRSVTFTPGDGREDR